MSRSKIAIDSSGNVWVTNNGSSSATELNSTGTVLGTYAAGNGPYGIAIDAAGNVWVTNYGNTSVPGNTITELNSNGTVLSTFTVGSEPGGIAIDSAGNIWVANDGTVNVLAGAATGPEFRPYSGPIWPF